MIPKNRRQLAQLLDERMNRTYSDLSERQELESDTSLVKTYLLETHLPETAEPLQATRLINTVIKRNLGRGVSRARALETDDQSLLPIEMRVFNEHVLLYLDVSNPRFWLVHSMASSNAVDSVIDRIVTQGPEFDHAWLPADLLEHVSKLGAFRGLSLDYDRRAVPDVDFQSPNAPVEFLKMQLWGNKASEVLRILRQHGAFPHETTLSKVKVKFWLSADRGDEFSVDDIKYDGKVTARGTSFQSHMSLLSHVYFGIYAKQVRKVETEYSLGLAEGDGCTRLTGEPINFLLDRPIGDLSAFCEHVFSSAEPFRLWGVPMQISKYYYRVRAVDLHVGRRIDVEVSPDFLRVYLPRGSCGNTILRLYTNLQHHYDSRVRAESKGGPIFEFQSDNAEPVDRNVSRGGGFADRIEDSWL